MRQVITNEKTLDELIESYYGNKLELDSYKKLCDTENEQIKQKMSEKEIDTYEANDLTAKITIQHRVNFNEEKLLEVVKSAGLNDLVKTKEYVDMDALESAIYNDRISVDVLTKLNNCKETKDIQTLKITRKKEK